MLLNGEEIKISSYTSETLDNEIVIYNEESQKIIVLNHTAMVIWKYIIENEKNNISTKDIVEMLVEIYNIPISEIDEIYNDTDESIRQFFESSLLNNNI